MGEVVYENTFHVDRLEAEVYAAIAAGVPQKLAQQLKVQATGKVLAAAVMGKKTMSHEQDYPKDKLHILLEGDIRKKQIHVRVTRL